MKTIIVVGNDKIGGSALQALNGYSGSEKNSYYVDQSTNVRRLRKIISNGSLSVPLLGKMVLCEKLRSGHKPLKSTPVIRSNKDLAEIIRKKRPKEVILFRAGLIINSEVLSQGVKILNTHCARLPDYGGIGSIARALKDKEYNQSIGD